MTTALVPKDDRSLTLSSAALSIQDLIEQKKVIAECMKELMKENEHYGTIPGAKKPSLFKPGADLIGFMFRLEAKYQDLEVIHEPGYIYYRVKCILKHIPTGKRVGSGVGSCNSRETKYVRPAPKKCPKCGGEFLIDGNPDYEKDAAYKGGMLCYKKKGGCGAKYKPDDEAITGQATGVADPSDLDNTICKMAHKRARIDAILTATAASDFFTQDVEDLMAKGAEYIPPKGETPQAASTAAPKTSPSAPAATPPIGATKAPRANTVKHDGTFASHKQVAYLHMLKQKVGGLVFCPENKACYIDVGDGLQQVVAQLCAYHKQLAAFKDCDGKPIRTSKDLSEDQASNLIERYEKKIEQQEARAAEQPDLAAAFDQAEENARIRGELGPGSDG